MNNNNNIAATIGIGAVGSILAYYGYTKLAAKPDIVDKTENHVMGGTGIGSTSDLKNRIKTVIDGIKNDMVKDDTIKDDVIKEINKTATPENKVDSNMWGDYWKNEYKNSNEQL